jgi:hypothetical protein
MNIEEELKRFVRLECLFVWSLVIDELMKEDGLNTDLWKTGGV